MSGYEDYRGTMKVELSYAIEDARRFETRTAPYLELAEKGMLTEADLKLIRRFSMDVTHAMKTLREAIEATPEPNETPPAR